uniref:Integrase catalytic domain-containing protein n=1 Tax=Strongyloides stercoralis TaxID=6248 RepID=A0A0K0ELQ0_STRER
ENFESNHVEINSLSKSDKLAKFLFDKFHRENSHMSYGKMKEDIVTELQGRKLSNYTNIEVLDKLIHLIKECEICNQNNPLKRKKKVRTMPNTVLKIVYGDFALINDHYVLVIIDGFSRYLWTFVTKNQSTELVCQALQEIEKQLDLHIQILRVDNFKSFTSPKIAQKFPLMKIEYTIPNEHTTNGVAERCIRTLRLMLKKEESTFRGRNNFERRVEIVTRNYNKSKHGSTGEKPRDLIFAFAQQGESFDPEDVKLRNLKVETLKLINNPVAFRQMRQGKPEVAVGILKDVNMKNDTVDIKASDKALVKRSVLKIRPMKKKF